MDPNSSTELEVTETMDDVSCADLSLDSGKRKATTLPAEDSDDDGGEEEGSGEEVSEVKDSESDNQEWGVDSFDGSDYVSSDEPPKDEDDRQFRRYMRHFHESRGFLIEKEMVPKNLFQGFRRLNLEAIFKSPDITGRQYMTMMANVAIDKYNQMENKTIMLVRIVRAVVQMSIGVKAYITFMAKESPEGEELVEYQAKAEKRVWQTKVHPIICRPAPPNSKNPNLVK